MSEDIIEKIEDEVAEIFTPKPGGLIERHRQERARREAAAREREQQDERIEEPASFAVKTAQLAPEVVSAITITVPAGGSMMILPKSDYRYRATIMVATAGSTLIIGKDPSSVLGGVGFLLPTGIPLPVHTRAQLWAMNNSAGPIQISVIAETYASEHVMKDARRA